VQGKIKMDEIIRDFIFSDFRDFICIMKSSESEDIQCDLQISNEYCGLD
jgi:hypothetical protein